MKRAPLWLTVLVALVLGVGIFWSPGYEPYHGPSSVTCSIGLPEDPFQDPKDAGNAKGFASIPMAEGMTIKGAAEKARFEGVDLGQYAPSMQRWATWSSRRATNRCLGLMNQMVHRIPVERVRIWWEEYSKGRGYESWDYDAIPSSKITWETPVRAGDQTLLLPK